MFRRILSNSIMRQQQGRSRLFSSFIQGNPPTAKSNRYKWIGLGLLSVSAVSAFLLYRRVLGPLSQVLDYADMQELREAFRLDAEARKNGYSTPDRTFEKLNALYDRAKEKGLVAAPGIAIVIAQKYEEIGQIDKALIWYANAYPTLLQDLEESPDNKSKEDLEKIHAMSQVAFKMASLYEQQRDFQSVDLHYRAALNTMTRLWILKKDQRDQSLYQNLRIATSDGLSALSSRIRDYFEENWGVSRIGNGGVENQFEIIRSSDGTQPMAIFHKSNKSVGTNQNLGLELAAMMDSYANYCVSRQENLLALSIFQKSCDIVYSIDPNHIRLVYMLNATSSLLVSMKMYQEALMTIRKGEELLAHKLHLTSASESTFTDYKDFEKSVADLDLDPAFAKTNEETLLLRLAKASASEEELRLIGIMTLMNKAAVYVLLRRPDISKRIYEGIQEKAIRLTNNLNSPKSDIVLNSQINQRLSMLRHQSRQ